MRAMGAVHAVSLQQYQLKLYLGSLSSQWGKVPYRTGDDGSLSEYESEANQAWEVVKWDPESVPPSPSAIEWPPACSRVIDSGIYALNLEES